MRETIHMTEPGVDPTSGAPMPKGRDFTVAPEFAAARYNQGVARPAAEVYLERLRGLGVVGIAILGDAEASVRTAASRVGIGVREGRAGKA